MTLVSGIPKEFLSLYFIVTSRSAPGNIFKFELSNLILAARDLVSVFILLARDSTIPSKLLSLFPENFISTLNPLFTLDENTSGISTSTNNVDASSRFITRELSETFMSSEKFLFPITPSKGAIIFLFFNFTITSPASTFLLNWIGSKISYFSILYDWT